MVDVERVAVPVETLAEAGTTNAYLVGADPAVLVDPAAPSGALEGAVARRGVEHVLVTHAHPDHVGAVERYADDATLWACAGFEGRFESVAGVAPDRTLSDGDVVTAGGAAVTALATPGHAPDHLAFAVGGGVLTGDLVVAEGSVVVGAEEGDMAAYLDSLARIRERDPDVLHPGHGPRIDGPQAELDRLIEHRNERERRVLDAVQAGARTPDDVVDAAYDKDLSGVRDLAVSTVVAHLRKLADEDRVTWDGERAELR